MGIGHTGGVVANEGNLHPWLHQLVNGLAGNGMVDGIQYVSLQIRQGRKFGNFDFVQHMLLFQRKGLIAVTIFILILYCRHSAPPL